VRFFGYRAGRQGRHTEPSNIGLSVLREPVVDDETDLLYIDASGDLIRGDKDLDLASFEAGHQIPPFVLREFSDHPFSGKAAAFQLLSEGLDLFSGAHENEDSFPGFPLEEREQKAELLF